MLLQPSCQKALRHAGDRLWRRRRRRSKRCCLGGWRLRECAHEVERRGGGRSIRLLLTLLDQFRKGVKQRRVDLVIRVGIVLVACGCGGFVERLLRSGERLRLERAGKLLLEVLLIRCLLLRDLWPCHRILHRGVPIDSSDRCCVLHPRRRGLKGGRGQSRRERIVGERAGKMRLVLKRRGEAAGVYGGEGVATGRVWAIHGSRRRGHGDTVVIAEHRSLATTPSDGHRPWHLKLRDIGVDVVGVGGRIWE